jgi:hypothetical protein
MIDLKKLIQEIKNEHDEFDFNSQKSMVNHCSYFGICVMQKLKDNGYESSTLLIRISNKEIPKDSILNNESNDFFNHNVVLFKDKIIDLSRIQFGTLIEQDITDKDKYLDKWEIAKETKSTSLNLKEKNKDKPIKKFKR